MAFEAASTRKFAVITDSTADIPVSLASERQISVVPLSVTFGEETFEDGDLTQEQFFARMQAAPSLPTTSQPSVGAFTEAYRKALDRFPEVVSVHISEKLSGTIESARRAAEQFGGRVHVFDSRNLSWGLGWQVMCAADAADEGLEVAEALTRLELARPRSKQIVGLDSLDNLARGGRIGRVSAFLGSVLNLKVTLTVGLDGAFEPHARSRGEKAALEQTVAWVRQQMGVAQRGKFAIGYALFEPRAKRLAEMIRSQWEGSEVIIYSAGSTICTHTGSGWGVAVLPDS